MACTGTTFPFPDSELLVYHTALFSLKFAIAYMKYPLPRKKEEISPYLWSIQSLQYNKNSNCTYYGRCILLVNLLAENIIQLHRL